MVGELPPKKNERGGVGWWMDLEGRWRAPSDWPGDDAPVDGWIRSANGKWCPPLVEVDEEELEEETQPTAKADAKKAPKAESKTKKKSEKPAQKKSNEQDSDVRALLMASTGLVVVAAIVLVVLLTQPGAEASPEPTTTTSPEVVFATETAEMREQRRIEAAVQAPVTAVMALAELSDLEESTSNAVDQPIFDESFWEAQPIDCLGPTELVLIERSATPILWADNLECVPSEGSWFDHYLDIEITRTIDAEVRSLIPVEIVHASGGSQWTPATRSQYVNDFLHPATLMILSVESGHNPRNAGPDQWRPSNESTWCGYAIDWIAVKDRWELTVTPEERIALLEMLETCSASTSDGPHLASMVIDPVPAPQIERS